MSVPTSEIKPRSGMKGKAVHIIHVYEDFLWAMGDKSEPPELQDVSDDEYEEEEASEENPEIANTEEPPTNATATTNEETEIPEKSEQTTSVKQLSTNGILNSKFFETRQTN
jgi:translation initiation factor 2D